MKTQEAAERFVSNTTGQVLSRLSMLAIVPMISVISYLGVQYFDTRFDAVDAKQIAVTKRVDDLNAALTQNTDNDKINHDRLIVAEQGVQAAREDRDRFQKQALDALSQLQATTMKLSETVAATNATLQEMQMQRGRSNP